jgi:hypothetical protein
VWNQLDPKTTNLESVYEPLQYKASQMDQSWSIAEIRLSADDINWLVAWFANLKPKTVEDWTRSILMASLGPEDSASYSEMLGGALLCVASEVCRDESREDSVWPVIRKILPAPSPLRTELFLSDGQPSKLAREVIDDAVRALNLRHAMDIEGTQQWFVTVKLQFGFTYHGAKSRLAEWLVGLGPPHAVQYLNGSSDLPELASDSFRSMWRALKQYRRGLIGEDEVRETLRLSPWVKAQWIDDILLEARARIEILGTGDWCAPEAETGAYDEGGGSENIRPVASVSLDWQSGAAPRLRFLLDREVIVDEISGTEATELDFFVDGRRICRWLRQGDGSLAGDDYIAAEPQRLRNQPNLSPKTLTVCSGLGEVLMEWDFSDSGLSEEVLVFDLERAQMLKAGNERLEHDRAYAIICDRVCEIGGCLPEESFERDGTARKVLRLPRSLSQNLCITYGEFVLWQPVQLESQRRPHFVCTLSAPPSQVVSFGDRTPVLIEGLPEAVEEVKLLIHRKTYDVERHGTSWRTTTKVTITPELAAQQRRVRVRFSNAGQKYTVEPRIAFPLLGAAMIRHKVDANGETISLEPLGYGTDLNRSEGTTHLRIWTPEQDKRPTVLEGNCQVGRLRHSRIKLRDIPGHGGELHVFANGERMNLGVRCQDSGRVRGFIPSILNAPSQLLFLRDTDPNEAKEDGYAVYEWVTGPKYKATIQALPRVAILPNSNERVWQIECSSKVLALAVTWKGAWLGGWHSFENMQEYISSRTDLPEHDFAMLKWLRVPVLHPMVEPAFRKVVAQTPARFIRAWLEESSLPEGLRPHECILGCDSVVRHFLLNELVGLDLKEVIAALGCCRYRFDSDRCCRHLAKLANVSIPLFWRGMMECGRRCPGQIISLLRLFIHSRVGLGENARKQTVDYRLQRLGERATSLTGIVHERLERLVWKRTQSLEQPNVRLSDEDRSDLMWLGGTRAGREYLAAKIALHRIS